MCDSKVGKEFFFCGALLVMELHHIWGRGGGMEGGRGEGEKWEGGIEREREREREREDGEKKEGGERERKEG